MLRRHGQPTAGPLEITVAQTWSVGRTKICNISRSRSVSVKARKAGLAKDYKKFSLTIVMRLRSRCARCWRWTSRNVLMFRLRTALQLQLRPAAASGGSCHDGRRRRSVGVAASGLELEMKGWRTEGREGWRRRNGLAKEIRGDCWENGLAKEGQQGVLAAGRLLGWEQAATTCPAKISKRFPNVVPPHRHGRAWHYISRCPDHCGDLVDKDILRSGWELMFGGIVIDMCFDPRSGDVGREGRVAKGMTSWRQRVHNRSWRPRLRTCWSRRRQRRGLVGRVGREAGGTGWRKRARRIGEGSPGGEASGDVEREGAVAEERRRKTGGWGGELEGRVALAKEGQCSRRDWMRRSVCLLRWRSCFPTILQFPSVSDLPRWRGCPA